MYIKRALGDTLETRKHFEECPQVCKTCTLPPSPINNVLLHVGDGDDVAVDDWAVEDAGESGWDRGAGDCVASVHVLAVCPDGLAEGFEY